MAVLCRENAIANERAMMRKPLTLDDYMESRWIVEPFRLLDCCLETDGAVAVVVVPADRSTDLRHPPVYVRGAAWGGGYNLVNSGYTEWPPSPGTVLARRVYDAAGLGPDEIDFAELYDCFTYSLLVQLEISASPRREACPECSRTVCSTVRQAGFRSTRMVVSCPRVTSMG